MVSQITKCADNALKLLVHDVDANVSRALDRAYANGAAIETNLDELIDKRSAASVVSSARGNSAGRAARQPLAQVQMTQPFAALHETYRSGSNVPAVLENLHLEFDTQDEDGQFCALEGELRSALLSRTTSHRVVVARGAARCAIVHGATGMAGVGKTTALVALGHDETVRNHFQDGVLFMALGADATVESVACEISRMMKFTGAKCSASAVRNQADLSEAVEDAAIWFQGRRNLFLIDDVWPTKGCVQGYLSELRKMLEGSPDSRIALTTRSRVLGSQLGAHVDFGARVPCGEVSRSIFMLNATTGWRADACEQEDIAAVDGILNLCAGLPIAWAVTGRVVAARVCLGDNFAYVALI